MASNDVNEVDTPAYAYNAGTLKGYVFASPDKHYNKLFEKIKENFTEMQQQMFLSSPCSGLNYNQSSDFLIDLDDAWKWLGYKQKVKAKQLLENHFIINVDYKYNARENNEEHTRGGNNIIKIMLTPNAFKRMCMKADTEKSSEIHKYYIKLEEILHLCTFKTPTF